MLEIVTPASDKKLCTLSDLKEDLNITTTSDDAALTRIIEEASDVIRSICGREFTREVVKETLESRGGHFMILERTPVNSISSIKYNTLDVDLNDILIDDSKAGIIFKKGSFESTLIKGYYLNQYFLDYGNRLWEITYDAGYDPPSTNSPTYPMPRDIQRACLEISKVIWIDKNKNPNLQSVKVGEASETRFSGSGSFGIVPEYIDRLLGYWKRIE